MPIDEKCHKQIPITHFQMTKERATLQSLNRKALLNVREQLNSPPKRRHKANRASQFALSSCRLSPPRLPKLQFSALRHPGDVGVFEVRTPNDSPTNSSKTQRDPEPEILFKPLQKARASAHARDCLRKSVSKILKRKRAESVE